MTLLVIDDLSKQFGALHAVDHLSLAAEHGEMLVLVGPSGCGKTTSLRCIAGLEEPTSGSIRIGGRIVNQPQAGIFVPPEKRALGMVFQSYAIWPHMTVFNNVAYPLKAMGLPRDTIKKRVEDALQLVQLQNLAERYS